MNIWIFNHYAVTPEYSGGTRHYELGKQLVLYGHQVTVFSSSFIHMSFTSVEIPEGKEYRVDEDGGLRFIWVRLGGYRGNNLKRLLQMMHYNPVVRRVIRRLEAQGVLERPDVIIGSVVHPFAPLLASSLAKKYGIPYIFEIRDLWPQSFIDLGIWKAKSLRARFFKAIEKKSVEKAKKIIVLSPLTRDYLVREYGYNAEDIYYIPNGAHVDPPEPGMNKRDVGGSEDRMERLKAEKNFIALFSGSLIASNRLDTIVDAAEKLREEKGIKIVMLGRGQEEAKYRQMIQAKKLDNLLILAPVRKEWVPYMLRLADILILNQGVVLWGSMNKLYEYMASGRPIISSIHAKHNSIVGEVGGGIIITPNDGRELAEAIMRFHQIPVQEREVMGQRNREYIRENHDWKVLGRKIVNVIEDIVG